MTDASDVHQLDPGHLTIQQATDLYDVSASTLRRRLRGEGIPGAEQVPSPFGDTWIVPAPWLAANYVRRDQGPTTPTTSPAPSPELDRLVTLVEQLSTQLAEAHQRELAAAQEQLQLVEDTTAAKVKADAAVADTERLRVELDELRSQRTTLADELAQARVELVQARRRWWRRNP